MRRPAQAVVVLVTLLLVLPASAQAQRVVEQFQSPDLAQKARLADLGEGLRLEGVPLGPDKAPHSLELRRIRVFAPGAQVVVHSDDGEEILPAPNNAYFRGYVEGMTRSRAFLTVRANGQVRGLIGDGGRYWMLHMDEVAKGFGPLTVHEIDATTAFAEKIAGFECENEKHLGGGPVDLFERPLATLPRPSSAKGTSVDYTARVAVETDFEYYNQFGNSTDATDYIGDVFGFMSGIYEDEVATSIYVSHVSLWSTAADPWDETGSSCALFEFGKYWNDNNGGIDRTIAHLFSGKSSNAGVAWVGVLCHPGATQTVSVASCSTLTNPTSNYVGGYGFTGGIDGIFNPNNPTVIWDIIGTTHEVGHNFDSPHTHCYVGQAGASSNIDECFGTQTNCFSGTPTLPAGCPGTGQGCGTIMSYCHLTFSGGLSNIAFSLGEGHPYGDQPERVPARMSSHVISEAAQHPGCLDLVGTIFSDGFESGDTTSWTSEGP